MKKALFPLKFRKIIWDSATDFEKEFQSWWNLLNFTYEPILNTATVFVLIIRNASVYLIFPVLALELNYDGAILYLSEHREWTHQSGKK